MKELVRRLGSDMREREGEFHPTVTVLGREDDFQSIMNNGVGCKKGVTQESLIDPGGR